MPYTYVWSPAVAGNTNTAAGLPAGNYQVTIYDATGCSTVVTITVNGTAGPSVGATSTPAGCTVANGSATANPSGGTPGYTYLWSNGDPNQVANNLAPGTYNVTVTDANGCTAVTSVVVGGTSAPTVSATSTQAGCTVANGSATATPSGGTSPYTYLWSNGDPNQTANNLSAGTYTVTVTDANGCSSFTTVSVTTINGPSTTAAAVSNVLCNGGNTGSATATPSGGTPAYTYAWSPSGGNSQTANNLSAGTYNITVTDANGCSAVATVSITEPTALAVTATTTSVICNGGTNGTAAVNVSGGTPGYSYSWNSIPVQNTQTANNLSSGTYQCTVIDANGCTSVISATITQPTPIVAPTTPTNVMCNGGNNGAAAVNVSGGTPSYSYLWNTTPAQNTQTANNLPPGNYSVAITDANGCTSTASVTITQPPPLTLSVAGDDSVCAGDSVMLTAIPSGGTPAYTYVWIPGPQNGDSVSVSPTTNTSYTVTMTDANGCTSLPQTFNVLVLPTPTANFDTASSGTYGSMFAFTDLSSNGTSWSWDFGDNTSGSILQNPVHTFPGAGTYTVTQVVFNQYGCPDTFRIIVEINEGIIIPNVFTPDNDGVNDVWYIPNSGMKEFHVDIYDRWGLKVFETTADEIRWDGHSTSGKLLNDGTYYFVLKAVLKSGYIGKDYSTNGFVTLLTKKR